MQLYFIRHAQSTNNALWDRTGSSKGRSEDPELTETGVIQADLLGKFVKQSRDYSLARYRQTGKPMEFNITHLYTSPMVRAVATAHEVSKNIAIAPVLFKDLHEAGGIYLGGDEEGEARVGLPGKNGQFYGGNYPEVILPSWLGENGWWDRPYEERQERLPRAKRVLVEILARHGGSEDQVMLVSHGAFYNYFLRALLDLAENLPGSFVTYNTSISRIDFWEDEFQIIYLNRTDHLPPDLLT